MTSFCLQITKIPLRNIAVTYLGKFTDSKNFAALPHKLNMSNLANLHDVLKGMVIETSFRFDLSLEA